MCVSNHFHYYVFRNRPPSVQIWFVSHIQAGLATAHPPESKPLYRVEIKLKSFQQVVPHLLPALSAVSTQRPEVCCRLLMICMIILIVIYICKWSRTRYSSSLNIWWRTIRKRKVIRRRLKKSRPMRDGGQESELGIGIRKSRSFKRIMIKNVYLGNKGGRNNTENGIFRIRLNTCCWSLWTHLEECIYICQKL